MVTEGHRQHGDADWQWITRVKEVVDIPVVLNGGVFTAEDAVRAFKEFNADAVMIARGAIEHPWIFREAKYLLETGRTRDEVTPANLEKTWKRVAVKDNTGSTTTRYIESDIVKSTSGLETSVNKPLSDACKPSETLARM